MLWARTRDPLIQYNALYQKLQIRYFHPFLRSQLTNPTNKDKLSLLRIITEKALRDWSKKHARAKSSLVAWVAIVRAARWESFAALRRTFPSVDQVVVASGRNVMVFNIAGNQFRLICAIHYNTGLVFALRFMTHAEYSKDSWKNEL